MEPSKASEEQVRAPQVKLNEPDGGENRSTKPNRNATKKTNKRTTKATRTKATPDADDIDSVKVEGDDSVKVEGDDGSTKPNRNATKKTNKRTTKATRTKATPDPDDIDTAKVEGDDTAKVEGDDTAKSEGDDTAKVEGDDTAKSEGDDTAKVEGDDTAKVEGDDTAKSEDATASGGEKKTEIGRGSLSGKAKTPPSDKPGDASDSKELLVSGPQFDDEVIDTGELEPVSESVRYILARPGGGGAGKLPTRIAVVAALPGEGATTISRVFASVVCHDFGIETCRVDLSWGSTSKPGVYEVLIGDADVDDVLDWNGPTATLHSGGVSASERHRLARSEELDKLISVLAARFQHVIIDLPPILSGSDGLIMMRLADAYLLVVKHGVTTLRQVKVATEQLAGVESLGSVLNHVHTRTPRPLSRWLAG